MFNNQTSSAVKHLPKASAILLSFLLLSCAPKESANIPIIPPFKPAFDSLGNPWVFTSSEALVKVGILTSQFGETRAPELIGSDEKYVVVDHEWMLEVINWWDNFKWVLGLQYQSEAFDCDNFADLLAAVVDLTAANRNSPEAEILLGVINVKQNRPFGNVRAGGYHALNFFASNRGIFILEPQGAKSTVSPLEDYPNTKFIYRIILN